MIKDKIDVIIPAYKAHGTIIRALSSIACQTIVGDVSVTIVNDGCPEGDYGEAVRMFSPVMDVREIRMPKNGGPGMARQYGIDNTEGEFITFIDADDTLFRVDALAKLRDEIKEDQRYKCASGAFHADKFRNDVKKSSHIMVWVFGKLYRREFLDKYQVRFSPTLRANEDSAFNRQVLMLCDNPEEDIKYVEEVMYHYIEKPDSITNINGDIYYFDQGLCGGIDAMIYAVDQVRRYKPFSQFILQNIVMNMTSHYFEYVATLDKAPPFAIAFWEYVKKFYHCLYKPIESIVPDAAIKEAFTTTLISNALNYEFKNVIPKISFAEYMERLHTEEYDPNLINEIREEMAQDPEFAQIIENNIACGVCAG